jgi:Toprim domain
LVVLGFVPAWSLGDSGELARFPLLAGIEALTVIVDRDAAGLTATSECSRRWAGAGREVIHVVPRGLGEDLNDCIDLPAEGK